MPPVTDTKTLDALKEVFARWDQPRAIIWSENAKRELWLTCPELSMELVNRSLHEFIQRGDTVNRVKTLEPTIAAMEYKEFFYEFRPLVDAIAVYVKGYHFPEQFYVVSFHRGHEDHRSNDQ